LRKSPNIEPSGEESVSRFDVAQTHGEILEYWTEERMAEARPREIRLPAEDPQLKQKEADTTPSSPDTTEAEP
jgi:hypothetical protein